MAPQWYPHGFAVTFFVAEFGGTAVVSTSSWPSLAAPQWYPHGFQVIFFVAESGGTAVVSPRFCSQFLRGRVWWHGSSIPTILQSISSCPSLLTRHWLSKVLRSIMVSPLALVFFAAVASSPFAVNLFVAAPFLLRWHPRGLRMGSFVRLVRCC